MDVSAPGPRVSVGMQTDARHTRIFRPTATCVAEVREIMKEPKHPCHPVTLQPLSHPAAHTPPVSGAVAV